MCKLKNNIIAIFCFTVLILLVLPSFSQTKKELENKKKKLQKEIRLTNRLLKETRKNKDLSVDELLKLKSKINSRSDLISTMNSEMRLINKEINTSKTRHFRSRKGTPSFENRICKNYILRL